VKKWLLLLPLALWAAGDYDSVRRKFDLIESDRAARGARVEITAPELNAYVQREVAQAAPAGVRNPRVDLGRQTATGSALVDFGKLQRANGQQPGWLMGKLLDGERPVRVTAAIRSGGGTATVDVQRVEISGIAIEGRMLDYLIDNFLLPRYPSAAIGRPFELGHNIDRLDVQPGAVGVVIRR
jgi:hypothetical protein